MQNIKYLGVGESGEIRNAFHHNSVGSDIDLFWGNKNAGYAKIVSKHPEVIGKIQEILDKSKVYSISPNRIKLTSGKYNSVIGLNWLGKSKKWIITSYEEILPKTK